MLLHTPRQSFASQSTATLVSNARPSTASTIVATPRPSTATTSTGYSDVKRQNRAQEFIMKYGHKHHCYDSEKAPYPVSYDRYVLELESLDTHFIMHLKDTVTMVPEFKDNPPKRSLDLGCGSGTWVINAAKEWERCEFVGFDLVNVQLPLKIINDAEVQDRIQWVHGNFLTTKLPFDDDEFDHVHIKGISRGVPENKWDFLFAEINRVLCPGGAVEILEDDIVFPVLPRWFTAPLRARTKRATSVHYPSSAQRPIPIPTPPPAPPENSPAHDNALLEALYNAVFESRFINMRPSAVLPNHFTTYFRRVQSAPVTNFPMPAVTPPQPLPQPLSPNASGIDMLTSSLLGGSSPPPTRPVSLSFSSTMSAASNALSTSASTTDSTMASIFGDGEITNSESFSSTESQDALLNMRARSMSIPPTPLPPLPPTEPARSRRSIVNSSTTDSTSIGPASLLVPQTVLAEMNERSLAMHLYRSFQNVLSVQESMWEELKDWVRNKKDVLKDLGWDDDGDLTELNVRRRFEKLLERYESDMQTRISFWASLTERGFKLPLKEPLTKAEHIEEERIHKAIKEAMQSASEEDLQTPCRSVRVIIGFKSSKHMDEDFDSVQ